MIGKIKNDIILIIIIFILVLSSFAFWFINNQNESNRLYVNIYYDEKLLYSTPLDENNEYKVNGKVGEVHIVIKNGYVAVTDADCPNHICVNEGKKNRINETITCLPNLVYIIIGGHVDA